MSRPCSSFADHSGDARALCRIRSKVPPDQSAGIAASRIKPIVRYWADTAKSTARRPTPGQLVQNGIQKNDYHQTDTDLYFNLVESGHIGYSPIWCNHDGGGSSLEDEETSSGRSRLADVAIWVLVGMMVGVFWREAMRFLIAAFS